MRVGKRKRCAIRPPTNAALNPTAIVAMSSVSCGIASIEDFSSTSRWRSAYASDPKHGVLARSLASEALDRHNDVKLPWLPSNSPVKEGPLDVRARHGLPPPRTPRNIRETKLTGVAAQADSCSRSGATPARKTGAPEFHLVARVLTEDWPALATGTATPAAGEELAGPALLAALREGGFVIYFRHARTDFSQDDVDLSDLSNCATQRNLSAEGRDKARLIGEAIAAHGIPVGEVLSSELCRTRETAELAFGRTTPMPDLTSFGTAGSEAEEQERGGLRVSWRPRRSRHQHRPRRSSVEHPGCRQHWLGRRGSGNLQPSRDDGGPGNAVAGNLLDPARKATPAIDQSPGIDDQ